MTSSIYPPGFYENRGARTAHAAARLLSVLPEGLPRKSVADVGCGTGTWLAAALKAGAEAVYGFEGDWVEPGMLDDERIVFTPGDLERPLERPVVDLAISLEVAEHLSPGRAESFVADLVAMAPAVLFSGAIPGQGGVAHVNEQWQSYWARLFAAKGYGAHDVVRPAIWGDEEVPAWYRQNTVLYLRPELAAGLGLAAVTDVGLLDKVHPAFWERANRELAYANALPESEYLRLQRG